MIVSQRLSMRIAAIELIVLRVKRECTQAGFHRLKAYAHDKNVARCLLTEAAGKDGGSETTCAKGEELDSVVQVPDEDTCYHTYVII